LRGTGEHTDADISRVAVATLKWKTLVPDERIKITVSEGWVTLDGDVDWRYQKESAQEAARHLLGVKGVHNQIVVKPRASAARGQVPYRGRFPAQSRAGRVENPCGDPGRQTGLARRITLMGGAAGGRANGLGGAGDHPGRKPHHGFTMENLSGTPGKPC